MRKTTVHIQPVGTSIVPNYLIILPTCSPIDIRIITSLIDGSVFLSQTNSVPDRALGIKGVKWGGTVHVRYTSPQVSEVLSHA